MSSRASLLNAELLPTGSGGLGDESVDVAVFRFTLGIPGFDDDLVPRVVGGFCAALLAGNHYLAGSVPSDAQVITHSKQRPTTLDDPILVHKPPVPKWVAHHCCQHAVSSNHQSSHPSELSLQSRMD